ncbi:MAG: universal stress protein, partial [Planctomycetes bacterium]|nr:universal stress protein [Planctomycetota bacterium]
DKYRVMVAIANPANATALVQGTYKLCGAKDAQVELIHMLPVPDQVALTDAKKYMTPGKEALMEAMLSLSLHFTISTTIRYCRNIARGIVSAIRQKKTQMLVLGWHGKSSKGIFNLGATVDPIIEQTPCDVVVMKDCSGNKTFENVLVPVAGGPNSAFALEIATIMAETENSTITAFTVDRGNEAFDIDQFLDVQAEQLSIRRARFKSKTVKAKSTVLAILKESREHDLVVLGTTNKPMLVQMARQSLPEKIACRCKTPLVMVKKGQGVRSWIKRWI